MCAQVHKKRQRLHSGGALVKIGALAAKPIRSDDRLRAEVVGTDGTGQVDEIQCRHGSPRAKPRRPSSGPALLTSVGSLASGVERTSGAGYLAASRLARFVM